ncbi:MAG: MGMT family protein [Acidimicrobiia bacterium]
MSAFQDDVVAAIARLEPGEVVAYGEIAAQAGHPGAARAVGNILRTSSGVPWWRVVSSQGHLVPGCEKEQTRRLTAEGVTVRNGRVIRQE